MFRDWKSNGLEWEKSRLWKPARASVLLLALALWMLALISAEQPAPKGFLTRLSWFQRAFALLQALSFSLFPNCTPVNAGAWGDAPHPQTLYPYCGRWVTVTVISTSWPLR
jgi:hypothetical protein